MGTNPWVALLALISTRWTAPKEPKDFGETDPRRGGCSPREGGVAGAHAGSPVACTWVEQVQLSRPSRAYKKHWVGRLRASSDWLDSKPNSPLELNLMTNSSPALSDSSDLPQAGRTSALPQLLLEARALSFQVEKRTLWQGFKLGLREGERVGITGPSGTGKTLLLRTLAGLEPLQSGELVFDGRPLADWSMPDYRARVVYVPQRPTWREGTVEAALRAPFAFLVRRGHEFPDGQMRELLRATGRDEDFLHQRTERLSGGEAQIVAVVRTLLVAPSVLLLDEPTASLDSATTHIIEELIVHWVGSSIDRAYIWTSHDRMQMERISDRLLTLESAL